ncbi:TRAP transporter substrate-binding protein [Amorphus coralli]|uniref:TRAP transporter substrate-binding protein n=1 Tax=Amorphus coralli TaxID=340680 RepID=UPI000374BAE8|nr:TRAP transporter substrate-binding protein [Amorphus coralli]
MRRLLALAGAALILAGPAYAQDHTFKMGHAASSKHLFHTGLEIFAEKVDEKTDGQVKIEVYGDRQLGDDKQLLEGLQIGVIDGALVSAPVLPLVIGASSFDALQLPFVVSTYEEMAGALGSPIGQELLDTLDAKQIKGLGYIEAGQRHFLAKDKQVGTIDDFAGLKTRIVPIPLHKATWEAVGVNPIGMAYGEVYSALETGTIDAVEINLSSIQSESLFEPAKHATLTGHYFWPGVIMLSGAAWNKLPDDLKAAVAEAGREATQEQYAIAAAQEAETAAFLEEQGVEIGELEDLSAMQAKTQPVVDEWLTKDPLIQKFYDQIKGQ